MRISIVIPSYNQAQFLPLTLDSVLSQQYPDLEVLVVDDGSTDESLSVLKRYDGKIEYVSRRNGGQPNAINFGLGRATGQILAYLNSDDVYLPGALKCVVDHFRTNPESLVLYGEGWHLHEDGSIMERYYSEPWSYPRLLDVCYLCQPAVFWRREVSERFGLFDDLLHYAIDYDYWLRIGREVEFSYLEGTYLAGSRLHQEAKTLKRRVSNHHEILEVVMRHSPEPPYRWLMNLASVIVEAARQRNGGVEMDEMTRRGLVVEAVLENADAYQIPLSVDFLKTLEQMMPSM
jgi:glycosyltransferase involved in cell wall biosynthesis